MTVAPRSRAADDRSDVHPADRVERRRRLVEQDQLGIAEQCDGQAETLLHPLREAADRVVGAIGQTDMFEGIADGPPTVPRGVRV